MRAETKFDLTQKLYFLDSETDKIKSGIPYRIEVEFEPEKTTVYYFFKNEEKGWTKVVNEKKIFASRQELIDSL